MSAGASRPPPPTRDSVCCEPKGLQAEARWTRCGSPRQDGGPAAALNAQLPADERNAGRTDLTTRPPAAVTALGAAFSRCTDAAPARGNARGAVAGAIDARPHSPAIETAGVVGGTTQWRAPNAPKHDSAAGAVLGGLALRPRPPAAATTSPVACPICMPWRGAVAPAKVVGFVASATRVAHAASSCMTGTTSR